MVRARTLPSTATGDIENDIVKQPGANALREAQMLEKAKKAVWESSDWLSAADIANLAPDDSGNHDSLPSEWERTGRIFSIQYNGGDYYPGYGLDRGVLLQPHPSMAEVIKVLQTKKKGWGMAFWFASVNSSLGGKRPQDVLKTELDLVVAAAVDEVAGITHG